MRFLALLTAIGLSLALANSGMAQTRGGPKGPPNPGPGSGGSPDIRKLQAELDKLQEAIKDVESQLKKANAPARTDDRRGSGSSFGGGPGRPGPGGPSGFGGFNRGPGGPGGFSPMSRDQGDRGNPQSRKPSVEERLDKIERTLEEMKQMRNAPRR